MEDSRHHMWNGHSFDYGTESKRETVNVKDIIKLLQDNYPANFSRRLSQAEREQLSNLIPEAIGTLDEKHRTSDNKYAGESHMIASYTMKGQSNLKRICDYIMGRMTPAPMAQAPMAQVQPNISRKKRKPKRRPKNKSSSSKSSSNKSSSNKPK
jgi:hypothetical protein